MKPVRRSPWDTEFAVAGTARQRHDMARRWHARSARVVARSWPAFLQNRWTGVTLAALLLPGIALMYWRFAAPDSFHRSLGASALGPLASLAAWITLGVWLLSVLWHAVRAVRGSEPPGGTLARIAGHVRAGPYRAATRGHTTEALPAEHARRVDAWRPQLQRPPAWRSDFRFLYADTTFSHMHISILLGAACMLSTIATKNTEIGAQINFGPLLAIGLAAYLASGLATLIHHRRLRRRLLAALEHSDCPWCRYSLVGLPPALPDLPAAGPARCHECGSPWPLVPPPAPQ